MKRKYILAFSLMLGLLTAEQQVTAQTYECEELLVPKQAPNRLYGYADMMGEFKIEPVFVQAMPYQGRYAKVVKGKKQGLINCEGIMVVQPVYDALMSFDNSLGWALRENLWELVDVKGKVHIPASFQEVKDIPPYGLLSWVNKEGQWGLFSKEKINFIAKPQFDVVQILSDSASIVRKENSFGLVSHSTGDFILPLGLEEIKRLGAHMTAFKQKGKWGAFLSTGRVIVKPEYDSLDTRGLYVLTQKGQHYGLLDNRGILIAPPMYDQIGEFSEGIVAVRKDNKAGYLQIGAKQSIPFAYQETYRFQNGLAVVKKNGKYGVINRTNQSIIPAEADSIARDYDHQYFVAIKQGKATLLDAAAKPVAEGFTQVAVGDTATAIRVYKEGAWHYYDLAQKQMLGSGFEKAQPLHQGFAIVSKQGKKGLINAAGKEVLPFVYDSIAYDNSGVRNTFIVGVAGKFGVVDEQHRPVLAQEFELIANTGALLYKVSKNGRYGVIRSNGQWLVEPRYETMSNGVQQPGVPEWPAIVSNKGKFYLLSMRGDELNKTASEPLRWLGEGLYAIEKKGGISLMKANGEVMPEASFEAAGLFSSGLAAVKKDGRWGYINKAGKISIQPAYEEVTAFAGNAAYVKVGGKWGAIDKTGKFLLQPEYDGYTQAEDGTRRLFKK